MALTLELALDQRNPHLSDLVMSPAGMSCNCFPFGRKLIRSECSEGESSTESVLKVRVQQMYFKAVGERARKKMKIWGSQDF